MSDYNLIDEPWISVVVDYKGTTKLVGLKEFFEHAHEYPQELCIREDVQKIL